MWYTSVAGAPAALSGVSLALLLLLWLLRESAKHSASLLPHRLKHQAGA